MKHLPWLVLLLGSPAISQLCSNAACFGPPNVDPVVITNKWELAPHAVLDFGSRHVILAPTATLVLNGPLKIVAAKLTAQPGSAIVGTTVPASDLTIHTVAAGVHDGSATILGAIDLSTAPAGLEGEFDFYYRDAGNLTLSSEGTATVQSFTANCGGYSAAGSVTIVASAIAIGSIVSDLVYYGTASIVTLTSPGHVSIGSITTSTSDLSTPAEVHVTAGSYQQTGDIVALPSSGSGAYSPWSTVTINVIGAAAMSGAIRTGGAGPFYYGGSISVIAGGALRWNNAIADVSGVRAGSIHVRSLNSDVSVSGSLLALAAGYFEFSPGYVYVIASRDLDFAGLIDVSSDVQAPAVPIASLSAGGLLTLHPASSIVAQYPYGPGCSEVGGLISLTGCRVTIATTASVLTCGTDSMDGASVNVSTGDVFTLDGSVSATSALGGVFVTSRLAMPWAMAGSGTSVPPAVVTVVPGILPCLANATTVLSATSPATAGHPVTISVDSAANKPLLIVADTSVSHLPLGALGWTQVNVGSGQRVADALGLLGPAIPGTTDTYGHWSLTVVTPQIPVLSNVDFFFDVYVLDAGAANGVFHQPPFAVMHFN